MLRVVPERPELAEEPLVELGVLLIDPEPETPLVAPERSTLPDGLPAVELEFAAEPVPVTSLLEVEAPVEPVAELLPLVVDCATSAVLASTVVTEIKEA